MIRIFKLVLLLVVSQVAFGQAPTNYTNINGRYRWIAGMFDSTFHIPKGTTPSLRTGGSTNAGAVFYNTSDSSVYTYTGTQWIKLRGTIIDTTSLSNRINLKLNISDTASMLSPYLRKVDTTNKFVTQVYKKNGSDSVFYVRGGNHLWAFNDSTGNPGGGGGGKIYYFNGGVSMGTFGGFTMYELGDTANTGAAANFTRATTGNIANFITDPGKPGLLQIPAGVWTIDAYLSETGSGSNNAEIYAQVEKWDGSTITTIATSPIEQITNGPVIDLYTWSVSIPTTSLAVTDRIIIQFYIQNTNGKTVTLYTQNGYVGEVHTTFTTGIGAINGLTAPAQYLVTGTSGTDFNISSVTATHTFNLPTASATNRGALSSADWTAFNNKGSVSSVATNNATGITGGTITTTGTLAIDTTVISTRLWRQKGIDSVQSNLTAGLALKVNISDTSSMLLPYLRKVDTASLSNRINLKVNISDTASMLSPYLRAIDTASLSNRINLKVNISDTASMLSPYLRKVDTASLSNRINTKLNISDTATMLANYINNVGYGITKASQVVSADSATLSAYYLRRKDSLTSTNLLGYVTRTVLADSAAAIRAAAGAGTVTGSGTATEVAFWNSTSSLSSSSNLYWDNANSRLGINNSTPSYPLTVNGSVMSTAENAYYWTKPSSPSSDIYSLSANSSGAYIYNHTTANTLAFFAEGGNVGIGTVTPDSMLTVTNGARFERGVRMSGLPTGVGTKAVRIDANGTLSVADTTTGGISGSGTTNYIPKFTSSSAIGNSQVFDNGTNVGIGTTSPAALLHVSQASANTIFRLGNNTTYDQFIYFNGNNDWSLGMDYSNSNAFVLSNASSLGTNDRLVITTGGNVGIGTTTIGSKLQVNGNAAIGYSASTAAPTNGLAVAGNIDITGTSLLKITGNATNPNAADALYLWNEAGFGPNITGLKFAVNTGSTGATSKRFIIESNGNVGIGTTSPLGNLDVSTSGNTAINITAGSTALSRLIFGTTSGNSRGFIDYDNTSSVRAMIFRTNESERMRITSGGNIGIGTTTIGSTLQVNGNAAIGYSASTAAPTNGLLVSGQVGFGVTPTSGNKFWIRGTSTTSGNTSLYIDNSAGTSLFYVRDDGTIISNSPVIIGNGETAASPSTGIISGTGGTGTNIAGAEFRIRGGASTGNAAGGPITFYTSAAGSSGSGVNAATERMRINSVGEVRTFMSTTNTTQYFSSARITIQQTSATNNNFANLSFLGANADDAAAIWTQISSHTAGATTGNLVFGTTNAGSAATERMRITNTGTVGIGTTTIGSTLQVNGNAAIGYSASTAAASNGLAVAGNVGVGIAAPTFQMHLRTSQVTGFTGFSSYDKLVIENGNSGEGVNIQLVSNATNGVSEIGFSDATRNQGLLSYNHASDIMNFGVNGSTRFSINSSGILFAGNGETAASPSTGIISGTGGSGTNIAGAEFRIRGGASTGSGAGGPITFYTAAAGASGTTVRAATEVGRFTSAGDFAIGATSANSKLHVAGSLRLPITTKTATYTLDATDYTVRFDCVTAAANLTANLPDATTCTGRIYTIISNSSATYQLTVDGNGGQTIGGDATIILDPCYNGATLVIQSDGSNWQIISFTAWGGNRC